MEEPRIGVYICWCGTNISLMVDVESVAAEMNKLQGVIVSKDYKYMCSDPGQDMIIKDIREHNLNRVVVAACSPRMHENTFRKALAKAGINPYLFEMANIREQDSWVHADRKDATAKAKALITAAINRVKFHEPLDERTVEVNSATLIIGAGISGITAALEIADAGKMVYLIEKNNKPGGRMAELDLCFPFFYDAGLLLDPLLDRIQNHPLVEIYLESEVKNISGYIGNYTGIIDIHNGVYEKELHFGNIIIATGLQEFNPENIKEYGYRKFPDVITSTEFEKLLKRGTLKTSSGEVPKNIAIIHCVGSRNKNYHEYCSRTCCATALKFINQLNFVLPNARIYDLYSDMRVFGKDYEELYTKCSTKKVKFLMFDQQEQLPLVRLSEEVKGEMLIDIEDKLSGLSLEVPADLVILMVASEARPDTKKIAHATGLSICGNSFFIEKHPKLDPVATTTDGVYITGACQSPKDIADSVSQARAAAARILSVIAQGNVHIEVTTAFVNEKTCAGCQICVSVCPYSAIGFEPEKKVSQVNEALCKGCGTCGAACPTGTIKCRHFTDEQILSQIEGIMSMSKQEVLL